MKPFDLGLFVGRFQHFHKGHEHVVDMGLKLCDRLLILTGSAQEVGTIRNPFDISTRIEMIKEIYEAGVIVKALPDLTNEDDIRPEWGKFILDHVRQHTRKLPDIMIYGNDEQRSGWFDPNDISGITEVIVSRATIDISATKMRQFLVEDNFEQWSKYTNPKLHKHYDFLRRELRESPAYRK